MLLAFLVLFSTVSFTIEKHFCGDVLIDVSVFTESQKCGMGISEMAHESMAEKTCCKDEVSIIQGQDDLRLTSFEDLNIPQSFFITAFTLAFVNLFEGLPQHVIPHKQYAPPTLVADIQVLHQVFLI